MTLTTPAKAYGIGGILCLAVLCLTEPAGAQQPPSQGAPAPTPTPAPQPQVVFPRAVATVEMSRRWQFDARRMMENQANLLDRYRRTVTFAECAQRVTPSRVANLLEQPLATPEERRAANSLIRFAPGCLGNSLLVSTRLLRGAAAEAVLEGYRSADPDTAREISSTRMEHFLEATPGTGREKDKNAIGLTHLTQCQVLFAPGLSRKLLAVPPDSREEGALRIKLAEGTAMCGQVEAKSDLAWLIHRSYLAEALYHWTRSAEASKRS